MIVHIREQHGKSFRETVHLDRSEGIHACLLFRKEGWRVVRYYVVWEGYGAGASSAQRHRRDGPTSSRGHVRMGKGQRAVVVVGAATVTVGLTGGNAVDE